MPKLNDKGLEIYIFVCLAQQLEAYSYSFNNVLSYEGKEALKKFQYRAKRLMEIIDKALPEDAIAADAKIFDDTLRIIREAEGEKKFEMYKLLSAYSKGQLKIEERVENI